MAKSSGFKERLEAAFPTKAETEKTKLWTGPVTPKQEIPNDYDVRKKDYVWLNDMKHTEKAGPLGIEGWRTPVPPPSAYQIAIWVAIAEREKKRRAELQAGADKARQAMTKCKGRNGLRAQFLKAARQAEHDGTVDWPE